MIDDVLSDAAYLADQGTIDDEDVRPSIIALTVRELRRHTFPPRRPILIRGDVPIFYEGNIWQICAERGFGKTWVLQTLALAMACPGISPLGFYTMQALNLLPRMHLTTFKWLHASRRSLTTAEAWADFLKSHGVDRARALQTFTSFGVQSQRRQADARASEAKLTSIPTSVVDGKFRRTPGPDTIKLLDVLVAKARAERQKR